MRLDERLALLVVAGAVLAALLSTLAGVAGVLLALLGTLLAARALAGSSAARGSRERIDLALALGVAGFALVLLQRLRAMLGL